ncbi:hypothetical protein ES703_90888 [subsurface metagenome]
MSRTVRATGTITLCVKLSQDTKEGYPATKFNQAEGTAEYQGGGTLEELKAHLESLATDWAPSEFPKSGGHNSIIELVNASVVVD